MKKKEIKNQFSKKKLRRLRLQNLTSVSRRLLPQSKARRQKDL